MMTRRARDAVIRNGRLQTRQLTIRESLALPTKTRLPLHPCPSCGKPCRNAVCTKCLKDAKRHIESLKIKKPKLPKKGEKVTIHLDKEHKTKKKRRQITEIIEGYGLEVEFKETEQ